MSGNINNYNSTIVNQVVGTQINQADKENSLDLLNNKLDEILERLKSDDTNNSSDIKTAINAIRELRDELGSKAPKPQKIERSISVLGSISSIASLVEQIRPFLKALF